MSGNVICRTTNYGGTDYHIFKYSAKCVHKNLWNPVNMMCRGLIMTGSGNIIARPFKKFFNIGEKTQMDNLPWDKPYKAYEKLDGCMLTLFYIEDLGEWRFATMGSMESIQAIYATDNFLTQEIISMAAANFSHTFVYEMICPMTANVVDYGDQEYICSLGAINKHNYAMKFASHDHNAAVHEIDPKDIKYNQNSEGYVIIFENGLMVKSKSPEYVKNHKILHNLNIKSFIKYKIKDGDFNVGDMSSFVMERYLSIEKEYKDLMAKLNKQIDCAWSLIDTNDSRKDIAKWLTATYHKNYWPIIFNLLDGKCSEKEKNKFLLKSLPM